MEKQLTKNAMFFSVGLLFLLVCAVGAFLYGVQIGSDKTESKYASEREAEKALTAPPAAYQQQDLVSFYHTVFLPYREFQNEWFDEWNKLAQGNSTDAASIIKELSRLANKKATEAGTNDMKRSPLLGQAQQSYIRSLMLFQDATANIADSAKSLSYSDLKAHIEKEETYKSAVEQALSAQQAYYYAMQKWASTIDPKIPAEYKTPAKLNLKQWNALPITVKNKIMADHLMNINNYSVFYPHDLTSGVDDFIQSGKADKMKLQTTSEIVDLLINTNAVRSGDFISNKSRLHEKAILPQLPFFYNDMN